MPGTRRNENSISRTNLATLSVNLHHPLALYQKVELLTELVVVTLRRTIRGNGRFCQTLIGNRRIGSIEDTSDR